MTQRQTRITAFEARSLMLIASATLGVVGSAYTQSTAAPAAPAGDADVTAAFVEADKNGEGKLSREEAATRSTLPDHLTRGLTPRRRTIQETGP